jgi:hypothetical protein
MNVLLALGLLLSTSSQLRPTGVKFGLGEACLVLWVVLMLDREARRLGPPLSPGLTRMLTYWVIFAIALCLGTMTGFVIGDIHDSVLFRHDAIAFAFAAAISCLCVVEPGADARMRNVAWLLTTSGAAWLALQAALGWGLFNLGDADPWEWDRLRGLSQNSNQLALFCTVVGLLSLHLTESSSRPLQRVVALVCMIIAIAVGRLTQSNAFLIALLASTSIFVALKFWRWLTSREMTLSFRSASAWMFVLTLPLAVAYIVPLAASVANPAEQLVTDMVRGAKSHELSNTADLRFEIWNEALRRGIEVGMLGLGPGPHIEIPRAIQVGRRGTVDPVTQPTQPHLQFAPNFEAHNTALDLFVQSGLLGVSALVWLLGSILVMTFRLRLDALTTTICGLALFSLFHLIVRQPIVWFAIAFCLVTAIEAARTAKSRAWS